MPLFTKQKTAAVTNYPSLKNAKKYPLWALYRSAKTKRKIIFTINRNQPV